MRAHRPHRGSGSSMGGWYNARGLYRADVAHTDDLLGRLIETLDEEGILDRALLIVTSDHGEEFMEHGWLGHGTNIHHELTHVPLLVRWPGGGITGTYEGLVGHTDMTPTILEAFGIDVPAALPGTSLQSRLTHPEVPGQPPVYLLEHWNGTYGLRVDRWMIVTSRTTTSLARTRGHRIWYQDPGRNPVTWLYLRQRLAQELLAEFKSGPSISGDAEIDDETREQLEAMGYILSGDDGVAGD